jgi:membrane fusion protein, multidrug efflux system
VLARIDDRDYRTALDAARARLAAERADIENLRQQVAQQRLAVVQARATVAADQAVLTFAQQQSTRYTVLARNGAGTVQNAQQWHAGRNGSGPSRHNGVGWDHP